ncbi:hypothetical protein JCM8547_008454 [Rhodosporidiobolus lusitaniae]
MDQLKPASNATCSTFIYSIASASVWSASFIVWPMFSGYLPFWYEQGPPCWGGHLAAYFLMSACGVSAMLCSLWPYSRLIRLEEEYLYSTYFASTWLRKPHEFFYLVRHVYFGYIGAVVVALALSVVDVGIERYRSKRPRTIPTRASHLENLRRAHEESCAAYEAQVKKSSAVPGVVTPYGRHWHAAVSTACAALKRVRESETAIIFRYRLVPAS